MIADLWLVLFFGDRKLPFFAASEKELLAHPFSFMFELATLS